MNWIQFDSSPQKVVVELLRPYQQREEESQEPIQIQWRDGQGSPPLPGVLRLVPVEEKEQDGGGAAEKEETVMRRGQGKEVGK